jgi:SAM-dependent methyltransferase
MNGMAFIQGRLIYTRTGMPEYKRYLDEMPGLSVQDVWTDIDPINARAAERLGYPTQKPLALLERIIKMSSNEGDVVLDPFCGCGTAVDAAQRLGRQWIGIDITFIAVDLIEKRLRHAYGDSVTKTYKVDGIPSDLASAQSLFDRSPFDFERWAVSLINAQPNVKQVGDKGVDGVARFYLDKKTVGRVLVSVKGGKNIGPMFVRDLSGTVETQKAQTGVLITMAEPTQGVLDAVNHGGTYTWPVNGADVPENPGHHRRRPAARHSPEYAAAAAAVHPGGEGGAPVAPDDL